MTEPVDDPVARLKAGLDADEAPRVLNHRLPLRRNPVVFAVVSLPADLTVGEAHRLALFVAALAVPTRAARVARAVELRRAGGTYRSIGAELGVSHQTVANYIAAGAGQP